MLVGEKADERLKRLLSWEDEGHDFKPAEVEKLIDAIDGLKAIDPACGSGAFPMGMLQKLVHVLKKLDPENKGWRKRQVKAAEAIESGPAREEALKAIERAFARDNDDYGRKLYLIEKCLYGVDIQPIAVQIAKLRFFISLVVDQNIDPNEENYGILPLPNLETKVVAANTLLGLHRGQLLLGSNEVKRLETELQKVRHDYFTARRYKRKKELRKQDKWLCDALATALESSGECTPHDSKRLAGWNPYDTNTHAPFFDPGWMFGLVGRDRSPSGPNGCLGEASLPKNPPGAVFDIVIGNPPYVRQEELKNQTVIGSDGKPRPLKEALKGQYECFTGTADLYVYFFERSLQLLRTGGVLSFITSNKYFRAGYGERLRTYLAYATRASAVLDFGDAPVFTSIAYPAILVTRKTRSVELGQLPKSLGRDGPPGRPQENGRLGEASLPASRVMTWTPGPDIREFPDIFERGAFALAQSNLKTDGWRLENQVTVRLLDKIRQSGWSLDDYCNRRLYWGVRTGLNEAFFIDAETRSRLIREHKTSAELIHPLLRGRDIKRWQTNWKGMYAIVFPFEFHAELKRYPAIHAHLQQFEQKLKARGQCTYSRSGKSGGQHHWLELDNNPTRQFLSEFSQPKVLIPAITDAVNFAPDIEGFFCNNKASICVPPSVPFSVAVLNSALSAWFATQVCASKEGGFWDFEPRYVRQFRIPPATPAQQSQCERLAEALIWLHGRDASPRRPKNGAPGGRADDANVSPIIAYFEQWLNGLVYELFFPGEVHARKLKLFDETAKLNPPDLAKLRAADRLAALQELHAKTYDKDATLRAMLFDLKSLDVVRVIEDVDATAPDKEADDKK